MSGRDTTSLVSLAPGEILEQLADGVVIADADGRVRWVNPEAERLSGRSATRALGRPLADLSEELSRAAARVRETGAPSARDGVAIGPVRVDVSTAPLADGGTVSTLRDRTMSSTLAEDARAGDRLSSFSTIAAGIAHEVKNPLGGIRGAAQLLARGSVDEPRRREYLELIVHEVDRIADLVDRLRDLAAESRPVARAPVDLNRLLHELALMQKTTGEAAIDLDLDPSLPAIGGDADALQRLFLNLLRNALEAARARVTIATRVETGRRWRDAGGKMHPLVRVSVADDGAGIARDARARLFEPFYTTKAKGTGLGLATAQRIARDHDGTIAAEARDGGGACFVVTLPGAAS